jgi:hypothetical protein
VLDRFLSRISKKFYVADDKNLADRCHCQPITPVILLICHFYLGRESELKDEEKSPVQKIKRRNSNNEKTNLLANYRVKAK